MKTTSHSEFGKLKSVYIKNVADSFVNDATAEREWKPLNFLSKPNLALAKNEYAAFESLLKNNGAILNHFPISGSVTMDSIYCRDAAIATDFGMIICNMGKEGRKNEPAAQLATFIANNIQVLGTIEHPGTLEGGDVAWLDEKTLAVGHTYRTNKSGIAQLKSFLTHQGIDVITVELPHYKGSSDVFHLMSILSPVDANLAVVYSPVMPIVFRNELLDRGFHLVEVPDTEFESMGCNVLAIAPRICMLVAGNPKTKAALVEAGCTVHEYAGNEISVKGGGGPTCLTRPMLREI